MSKSKQERIMKILVWHDMISFAIRLKKNHQNECMADELSGNEKPKSGSHQRSHSSGPCKRMGWWKRYKQELDPLRLDDQGD